MSRRRAEAVARLPDYADWRADPEVETPDCADGAFYRREPGNLLSGNDGSPRRPRLARPLRPARRQSALSPQSATTEDRRGWRRKRRGGGESARRFFACASPPNRPERDALRENSTIIWTMKERPRKGRSLS
jgi:hypothetical protein